MRTQEQTLTLVDVFRPKSLDHAWVYDVGVVAIGSLVIALFAQIVYFLPWTPVPITGQTFAVLLIAAMLGSKRGTACVVLYLAEGGLGLPFFAGGTSSFAIFATSAGLATTGGYLIGFIPAAFVTGWLAERGWDRNLVTTLVAMLIGNFVIYSVGVPWLAIALPASYAAENGGIWAIGLIPFILGDISKIVLATLILPSGWQLLNYLKSGNSKNK